MRVVWLAVLFLACLGAAESSAGAAAVAKKLEGEDAECRFLVFLCRQANRATDQAALTPPAGPTELLAFKRAEEVRLRTRDAVEAARVIAGKHPDEKPWCFEDPECEFLKDELGSR